MTINYHEFCLTPENFTKSGLNTFFNKISTNRDVNGVEFISSMEAINYPFFATQFHPEIPIFEFTLTSGQMNVPHEYEAILVGQYFARFFVNETRKNVHRFMNTRSENSALIYNYSPKFTALNPESSDEQTYFFPI